MAGAIFRVRRRVKAIQDKTNSPMMYPIVALIADIIEEEIERDAEFEFTRPMNPDPVTAQAKEFPRPFRTEIHPKS